MNNRFGSGTQRAAGFTLTELMIVLVIATILIGIAIPAYTSQMQKSRRTEAKSAVMDLAAREEQYYSTNNVYTTDPTLVGYAAAGSGATFPQNTGTYYQITVTVTAPTATAPGTFLVKATPQAGSVQTKDTQCTAFMVNQLGAQTATGTLGNSCWP